MRYGKMKNKGMAIILIAGILLGFLLVFAVLAIDFSRMYYVRGELQNAADAAALAGADKIDCSNLTTQVAARAEAVTFAGKNKAAGALVVLGSDSTGSTNTLVDSNPGNDITVGNWDASNTPQYDESGTRLPINAIRVRARRTAGSPGGSVSLLFGKLISGLTDMGVNRQAIAIKGPPFIGAFPICLPSCTRDTPLNGQWDYDKNALDPILCTDTNGTPPGQLFLFSPSSQTEPKMPGLAWTAFSIGSCPSASCDMPNPGTIRPYLQGQQPPDICDKYICTTNGAMTSDLFDNVQALFDQNKKNYDFRIGATVVTVTGWQIFIPVVSSLSCGVPKSSCPGAQGGAANPYLVQSYAKVLLTEVVPPKGLRFVGFENPRALPNQTVTCSGGGNPKTVTINNRLISSIGCSPCGDGIPCDNSSSSKSKLVK